jgi:hypothetical protein
MALPQKTASQIITDFELQVADLTELSAAEELALLNRLYVRICALLPWEFLKTPATGTCSTDATGAYITMPSDFAFFVENNQYTDNTQSYQNNAAAKVIFIGTSYTPYQIINFSDRRQYRNMTGYAYLDLVNSVIRLTDPVTALPTSLVYEFDYIKVPAKLATSDYPAFPGRFHDMLTFAMAVDNEILQLSDKAKSYLAQNQTKYQEYLNDMKWWNNQLYLN